MGSRQTTTHLVSVWAECRVCRWTTRARNAQAVAAIHNDRTGHAVHVEKVEEILYGDHDDATSPQLSITGALA